MKTLDLLHECTVIRVSSKTLLKHSKYKGDWNLILLDGWGYNNRLDKFYKIIRKQVKDTCPYCKGTGVYEYETGVVDGPFIETAKEDCFCTFRRPPVAVNKPTLISFIDWN